MDLVEFVILVQALEPCRLLELLAEKQQWDAVETHAATVIPEDPDEYRAYLRRAAGSRFKEVSRHE